MFNGLSKSMEIDVVDKFNFESIFNLQVAITHLKQEKNAVILAHYYQNSMLQELADFVGDSLDLSRHAAETQADIIVFCGVRFMGEVAKILNPQRLVLIPDTRAGCSLEDSCHPTFFQKFCSQYPGHIIVTYINSSVEVKALSDIIVTSSNAESIIDQLPIDQPILFAPDYHLGSFIKRRTNRHDIVLWPGTCIVHEQFSEKGLKMLQTLYPVAKVVAHPECAEDILLHADYIGSTRAMLQYVAHSSDTVFIVATESHILYQMRKMTPEKLFISVPGADGSCNCAICPHMARNTLVKLYSCLSREEPSIELSEEVRLQALKPLQRMLDLSKNIEKKIYHVATTE